MTREVTGTKMTAHGTGSAGLLGGPERSSKSCRVGEGDDILFSLDKHGVAYYML